MTDQIYHFTDGTWRAVILDVYVVHQFLYEVVNDYFVLGGLTDYRNWSYLGSSRCPYRCPYHLWIK